MNRPQPCHSFHKPEGPHSRQCSGRLAEFSEIIPVALCAFITWEYMTEAEYETTWETGDPHNQLVAPGRSGGQFHPSPGLMLGSCLIFGCCVSSFVYRRQQRDPCQGGVFILVLGVAAVVGYAFGASANKMLLGYLPWATCASMALSISGHALVRHWRSGVGNAVRDEEKS